MSASTAFRAILRSTSVPGNPSARRIAAENYAVIDNMAVEFASGLNLLTGGGIGQIHFD